MNLRRLNAILAGLLLIVYGQAIGQVEFSDKYQAQPGGRIPFGEASGISGKTPGLQSLTLTIYYRTKKENILVSVHPDGSWAGILPALPAKTRVLFQFNELRRANKADKERVGTLLDTTYTRFNNALVSFRFSGTDTVQTRKIIDSLFAANLHSDLVLYRNAQRNTLDTVIVTKFQRFTANKLDTIFNIAVKSVLTSNIATLIGVEWDNLKLTGLLNLQVTISGRNTNPSTWKIIPDTLLTNPNLLEELQRATSDTILRDKLNSLVALLTAYKNRLNEQKAFIAPITAFNKEQQRLIVFANNGQIYVSTLSTESLETAEILKYASIDVTGLLFPNFNTDNTSPSSATTTTGAFAGIFFMISPYIQDFIAWKSHKNKVSDKGYGIAPSLGVALFQVLGDNPKPIYHVGCSIRLSEAFRLNAGWSFFKRDKTDQKLQWMFGFGASLRVAYLGDLLRLLNATTSELPASILTP